MQCNVMSCHAVSISILKMMKMREVSRCHWVVALPPEESFWPIGRQICSEFQTMGYTKSSGRVTRVWRLTHCVIMFQCARILILLALFFPETRLSIPALYQMNWPPSLARLRLRPAVTESKWKSDIWNVSKIYLQAPQLFGGPEKGRGKGQILSSTYQRKEDPEDLF